MNFDLIPPEVREEIRSLITAAYQEGWEDGRTAREELKRKDFKRKYGPHFESEHDLALVRRQSRDWKASETKSKIARNIGDVI